MEFKIDETETVWVTIAVYFWIQKGRSMSVEPSKYTYKLFLEMKSYGLLNSEDVTTVES